MVTFFPMPYPRETLYSVIARYHIWSGNLNSKATLRDLFNTTSVIAGRELPANINLLLNNVPNNCTLTNDEIIKNHTLYKYYTAFLPNERATYIYGLMAEGNGSLIFINLGMCNNSIKLDSVLKYCPYCVESDKSRYGEAYYHVEHQIPGVLICNKHLSELKVCKKSVGVKNRQEYLNLEQSISNEDIELTILNERIIKHQKIFCSNINFIMNENFKFKEMNFFREHYLKKLMDKGLAESRMKIYQQELLRDFKMYYGEDYLMLLGCNFDIDNKFNWLTEITRKHRQSFHPIQHLLMIQYLNIDIKQLFNADYIEVKKGKTYADKTDEEKTVYRQKWLEWREKHPNNSKSFIIDLDVATYTWLNRHDKKWLKENSPAKKTYGHSKRIDWKKRDEEILQEVKKVVEDMYSSLERPERITIGAVGRKIGKVYLLQKYMDKMPKTKEYFMNNIETLDDVQIRRIKWAIKKLTDEGKVSDWKVIRLSGLGKESFRRFSRIIKKQIQDYI